MLQVEISPRQRIVNRYTSFPKTTSEEEIDIQINKLTNIFVNSATEFFGMTVASNKKNKGWWSI